MNQSDSHPMEDDNANRVEGLESKGPISLKYQPAVPVSNGKLAVWIFLSTEIMFFTALIGTYIVLRFGAPKGSWPTHHDIRVVEWLGALNTFVLICSSVKVVFAVRSAMMFVSVAQAFLVILFFIHFWWERAWKYVLTVPALIMGDLLVTLLIPDVGFRTDTYSNERRSFAPVVESGVFVQFSSSTY